MDSIISWIIFDVGFIFFGLLLFKKAIESKERNEKKIMNIFTERRNKYTLHYFSVVKFSCHRAEKFF